MDERTGKKFTESEIEKTLLLMLKGATDKELESELGRSYTYYVRQSIIRWFEGNPEQWSESFSKKLKKVVLNIALRDDLEV